jgi:hypothetical protein
VGWTPDEVEAMRDLVRQHAEETSLRRVAGEVGLTAGGVLKFIHGSTPRAKTRAQLAAWAEGKRVVSPEENAVRAIVERIRNPKARARAEALLRHFLRFLFEEANVTVPPSLRRKVSTHDGNARP